MNKLIEVFCLIGVVLSVNTAIAQVPMEPPPEAVSACRQKQQNDACGFHAPHGLVQGYCRRVRGAEMACVPSDVRGVMNSARETPPAGRRTVRVEIAVGDASAVKVGSMIPDSGQGSCFDETRLIDCPKSGEAFFGQDAQYDGARADYRDSGDGTIFDAVTGLTWEKAHHDRRLGWRQAAEQCAGLNLGGYRDWRLPTIKELYSIADFKGATGSRPFLPPVFDIRVPDASILQNDRFIATHRPDMMGQTWSATIYSGDHWGRAGLKAAFFFNFLDGRIKQAPIDGRNGLFYRCVRGASWGENSFSNNFNGTVSDGASRLVWQLADDGKPRIWKDALAYCENLELAGHSDWRLPNIKELQNIVDYSRNDPALDSVFYTQRDAGGWFWSSTTHGDNPGFAAYICFGKCVSVDGVDVHGAGAQRSDPKRGDPARFAEGLGGQKDEVRIHNYARCVRSNIEAEE